MKLGCLGYEENSANVKIKKNPSVKKKEDKHEKKKKKYIQTSHHSLST